MIAVLSVLSLGLHVPNTGRREILRAAVAFGATPVQAYDSVPTQSADFAALEKKRRERDEMLRRNAAKIKPYLQAISEATTPQAYSTAADNLDAAACNSL